MRKTPPGNGRWNGGTHLAVVGTAVSDGAASSTPYLCNTCAPTYWRMPAETNHLPVAQQWRGSARSPAGHQHRKWVSRWGRGTLQIEPV